MALLNNVIKINKADYNSLVNAYPGSVVIGGVSRTYDPNTIYLIDDDNQYAYKNINNWFSHLQTITNGDSETNACLTLHNNNELNTGKSYINFWADNQDLGCIGAIKYSSGETRPVYQHIENNTEVIEPLLTLSKFCTVDTLYSGNPTVNTSFACNWSKYSYLIVGIAGLDSSGYTYTYIFASWLTWMTSASESFRVDGFNASGAVKRARFYAYNSERLYICEKSNVGYIVVYGVCPK